MLPAEEPADDESMFDELIADQPSAGAAEVEPAPAADASSDDETASLIEVPAPPTPTQPPARSDRTPSAPEPPSRHRDASSPEPEPIAEPASNAPYDDIPLPDEPVDEDDVPPPDAMPVRARRPEPEPVPEPEPEPEAPVGLDADSVRKRYQDIRAAVRERSKSLEPMLSAAVIADVDGTTVVLSHPVEVLVGRLSAPHAVTIIREALTEVFGTELDVRTVHQAPGAAAPSATSTAPPSKQAAKARQSYSRPSRARDQSATPVPAPEPVAEPEEPEPPRADEDIPHDERAEMVADARTGSPEQRLDPDQVALELLKSELGARPLE